MTGDHAPLFSVVIATHDRPAFLAEAIDSVLAQSIQDFEVIVVDDASALPVSLPDDPRLRVVRRDVAGGPAAARNEGVANSRGIYVAFLDDDDWYTTDRLKVALDGLQRAPVTLCSGGYPEDIHRRGPTLEGQCYERILDDGHAPGVGTTALRRDCFIPFDTRFLACEDVDWWLRIAHDYPISTENGYCYLVRRHDEVRGVHGTQSRLDGSKQLLDAHREYFKRHRRARAFRWRRIGIYRSSLGDRGLAVTALLRSLAIYPERGTIVALLRVLARRTA